MSANVTRVEGSSGNYACCSSCHPLERTAPTTGGCPHIVIAASPCPPCCRAVELLWTRGCPELKGTTQSEARRVSTAGNRYFNSWDWEGEKKRKEKMVNGMLIASALKDSENLQGNTITVLPHSFWVIHTLVARKKKQWYRDHCYIFQSIQ